MSNEGIERLDPQYNLNQDEVEMNPRADGKYVCYSDHERIVKELEANAAENLALAHDWMREHDRVLRRPSLADAIKVVERLYDEWWDTERRTWLNVVLDRLKSLSTQEGK